MPILPSARLIPAPLYQKTYLLFFPESFSATSHPINRLLVSKKITQSTQMERGTDMTASQVFLYVIGALVLLFYIRRWIQKVHMKEYSVSEVSERMNDDSIVLLDVRTLDERNHKHIKGSLHIPINELSQKLKMLEKFRQKEIICYCHSGSRSFTAAILLTKNDFKAANMKGGMIEWNYLNLKS
jgi:rhodanese-related sulfurtransferase